VASAALSHVTAGPAAFLMVSSATGFFFCGKMLLVPQ
jgi:hypothetical protein